MLPFANMSGDPEQEYFADGMVEDILSALSRIRWLFVIARQSSFSYKGRAVDMKRIGRELGVRYVVEGSVRKSGNRVRMTAQLIDAETDAHIWADRYERELSDIFALQDEITERIVSAIEPTVRTVEIKRALAKPTDSLTAYDAYLRALPYYYSQTREAVLRAETLLQEAIDLDRGYAEALGTLADCIAIRISNGWHEGSRRRAIDEACEAARRALAVGPDNSTCLAAAAFAYGVLARRFEEALRACRAGDRGAPQLDLRAQPGRRGLQRQRRERQGDRSVRGSAAHEPARQQDGHCHLHRRNDRTLLCAPLRGERPLGKAHDGNHAGRKYRPLDYDRGSRASRSPRGGASRDRQDSRVASQSYARTSARRELSPRMDVRALSRRAAQSRLAGKLAAILE